MSDQALAIAVGNALGYLRQEGVEIPLDIQIKAWAVGAMKADGDLSSINAVYHDAVTEALTTYLEGGSVAGPKNQFKRAMIDAFGSAWDLGIGDGRDDEDALSWFNARVEQELSHIDGVFVQAKELRKDEEADLFAWATERADAYTRTLSAIYNAAVMWAKKNQMLTWVYGDTDHCRTCEGLNGKKHRASWYLARNYIPRQPGSSLDCGGYSCMCSLVAPDGSEITI